MRDFRDAKLMARTLREALAAKHDKRTVGESLEVIARAFGVTDWNTLSAVIKNAEPSHQSSGERRGNGVVQFAPTTEETLHRALGAAVERGQREATVEHLLLSLTRDPDGTAIMKAHGIELGDFRELLARSIENESGGGNARAGGDLKPSPAFQRVVQRSILDLQAAGGGRLTGANLLAAIFSEEESAAVRMLREHGIDGSHVVKATRHRRS